MNLCRQAHPRHRRPDARADRPGARHRQPLVGTQGFAIAAAAAEAGARVTLVAGPVSRSTRRRRRADRCRDRRADGGGGRGGAALRLPRSWSPPSPTGGSSRRRPSSRKPTARRSWSSSPTPTSLRELAPATVRPRLLVGFAAETDDVARQRVGQAHRQGRRLDRRQRRVRRRHGRLAQPGAAGDRRGRRRTGPRRARKRSRAHLVEPDR